MGTLEPIARADITSIAVVHKRRSTATKVLMGVAIGVVVVLVVLRRVLPKS